MAVESHRHANATVAGFRQPGPLGGFFLSHRRHGVCEGSLALLTVTGQQTCCCIYRRARWLRMVPALRHGDTSDEEAVVLTRLVTRVSYFPIQTTAIIKTNEYLKGLSNSALLSSHDANQRLFDQTDRITTSIEYSHNSTECSPKAPLIQASTNKHDHQIIRKDTQAQRTPWESDVNGPCPRTTICTPSIKAAEFHNISSSHSPLNHTPIVSEKKTILPQMEAEKRERER